MVTGKVAVANTRTISPFGVFLLFQAGDVAERVEMERRLQEVTDLLYLKQTQLEKMAGQKAGQLLALEREVSSAREEVDRMRR